MHQTRAELRDVSFFFFQTNETSYNVSAKEKRHETAWPRLRASQLIAIRRSLRLIMRAYDTVTLSGEEKEEKPDRQKEKENADV